MSRTDRTLLAAAVLSLLAAILPSTALPASAQQQNEIVLSVEFDGLQPNGDAPFASNTDGAHTPGYDENQNNNVVLANDLIGYRVDWNVNEVDGNAVVLTATLPEGMRWSSDPSTSFGGPTGCLDDGTTTIDANDGRDLFCVLDAEIEGSNGVIRPIAEVGSQFDGTSLTLQAFIGSDEASAVGSNVVETFASARPKADWIKGEDVRAGDPPVVVSEKPSEEIHGITDPDSGELGRIWLYPLRLAPVGGLVGAEKMDDTKDILIFDHAYQMPADAKLATGLVPSTPSGTARTACGAYDGSGSFAVNSPGTWTCALDAVATAANGYPVIRIDISGHNTSIIPALKGDGSANTSELMVGQIAFFVPESSFPTGSSFSLDIYNGISGTTDPVTLPTDLTPIQVWGSAPTSFDEAGVENNYAFWNASDVPTSGSPGRSFRHTVQYTEGPYQEVSKTTADGRIYRGLDTRLETRGGLGRVVTNTLGSTGFGWGHGISGPMSQLTPRGNDLVITAELDHYQSAPDDPYYYEPSALCVAIDTTHQELVELPALFDVNHLEATSSPYIWGNQVHDLTTQEASNTGPLAQVHIGAHPNFPNHVYSYTHSVETTLIDIPYVVEFAAALNPVDNDTAMHEVSCNNADVDGRGWVPSGGDLSVFDPNNDDRYEDITNVRLRVTGPMAWVGTEPNPRNIASSATWGTSINLNLQVRVKDNPLVNEADMELFTYASRAYTPSPLPHAPEDVVIWDPATMANPGTPSCTQTTNTIFRDHYGDGVDHNTVVPTGWCNLPFEDDGANSTDLLDSPHDFGGGGENAYETTTGSASSYTGQYPRGVHADKVTIVEAELAIRKTNLEGPNDVNTNGDTIEFELRPGIVGSSLDTLSDVSITDTLPAEYEFIGFTQLPTTTTNTNATTPPNNDGTALATPVCANTGQLITCDFGTQVGGWSDTIRYEVRVRDTTANATYTNTVTITGNDALSGLAKTPKTATAKSFTPAPFDESGIIKFIDPHVGPCDLADDCSMIVADGNIRFTLDVANQGGSDLTNYRIIDVLPHLGDELEMASLTLTGDGRTPESVFSGTIDFVAATAPGATFYYTADNPNMISRDPDMSETINTWCDAVIGGTAVIGTGSCPTDAASVTGVYTDLGTLDAGQTRTITLDLATLDNECGDIYTNNFGGRTDDILLPIRSNDVTATVGFCETAIDIEKDTNGVQADNDPAAPAGSNIGAAIPVGNSVTWTYVVENTGDVALIDATVTDSDAAVTPDCDIDGDGTFEETNIIPLMVPGDSVTCQATGTSISGQYTNDSNVSGTPLLPDFTDPAVDPANPATWPIDAAAYSAPLDPTTGLPVLPASVADDDPSAYWGIPSTVGVDIEKDTNGDQADTTAGPTIPTGGAVTWTYVIENTGELPIMPATVADSDAAVTVVCAASLADAGGDNVINVFLPGESITCTATGVATAGAYANTATVSGPTALPVTDCVCDPTDPTTWPTTAADFVLFIDEATGFPVTVNDADDSHYVGFGPDIDIEKATNGSDSDSAPGAEIPVGETVTWTYAVTNTGTTALTDAKVTDDQGVIISCDLDGNGSFDATNVIPLMLPGDTVTCQGTGTAVGGAYVNNATVSGNPVVPTEATCGCDPNDATTWPTDAGLYSALTDESGAPVAPVTDADPSHYTGTQKISGAVWDDDNKDGVQDAGERVRPGVVIELLDADGQPILDADGKPITTVTDANGYYEFNVPPGKYRLRFTPPAGLNITGGTGSDNDADPTSKTTDIIDVAAGTSIPNIDAGLVDPTVATPGTLAFTGSEPSRSANIAFALLAAGLALIVIVRRKGYAA